MLAVGPGHPLDGDPTARAIDAPHRVEEEDAQAPQRDELEAAQRQPVVHRARLAAARAPRPIAAMRRDLDRQREARDLFLKLHCAIDKAPMLLKPIQAGISVLPAPDGPLYTRRAAERTKLLSSHIRPAPEAVTSARADVRPTGAPAFRAFLRHRSTRVPFLRQAGFVALSPRVSLPAPVAPRSSAASRRKAAGSDALPPAGASSTAHASPAAPRSSPAAAETRERPALDPRRQDQSAPEVAQVVGQDAQLQAHLVRRNRWHDNRVQ